MDGEGGQGVATDDRRARFGRQAAERVERWLLADGTERTDGSLAEGGLFLAAGKVTDLRDELHELPLAGEADAFDEQLRLGLIAEESTQTREITFRADIAGTGFSERTGDALAGRRLQGGVVDERLIEQGGLVGRTGLTN